MNSWFEKQNVDIRTCMPLPLVRYEAIISANQTQNSLYSWLIFPNSHEMTYMALYMPTDGNLIYNT